MKHVEVEDIHWLKHIYTLFRYLLPFKCLYYTFLKSHGCWSSISRFLLELIWQHWRGTRDPLFAGVPAAIRKIDEKTADATVYLRGITRKNRLLQVWAMQKSRSETFLLLLGDGIGLAEGENKNQISRLPGFCQDKFRWSWVGYIIHHKTLKLEVLELSFWVANF